MASRLHRPIALPPEHHVARYCRPRWVVQGIVSRDAFLLREEEDFLSTNWLEYFHNSDRPLQISGVRVSLGQKFRLDPNGRFAVLNTGEAANRVERSQGVRLSFQVLGQASDPSHAGIFGYGSTTVDSNANDIALILARSVRELHPALE